MLRRILLTWKVVARTFGLRYALVLPIPLFLWLNLRIAVFVFMALDGLFFGKLRETQVRAPIIIAGNPRTGTTFLQRFLHSNGVGAGMQLWGMVYPSLVMRTLLKPFLPILEALSPARFHNTPAHKTGLTSVETDDASLMLRFLDGFFLFGFFLAWDLDDHRALIDPDQRDTTARDFAWLRALWRRNLVWEGHDRVVAKPFSVGPRMPAFLQAFPDAKVLYMARDPMNVIPSGLSLVSGVIDNAFGFWRLPEEARQRWAGRVYEGLVELMRRFHDDLEAGRINPEQVYVVRFDRMMSDFEGLMDELLAFVGVEPDDALAEAIRAQAIKQRSYSSKHKYDLSRFGLSEERIREDCAFFYERFLPDISPKTPAG